MKDLELEARLHDYYASFTPADSGRAVARVDRVVATARTQSGSRFGRWTGLRRVPGAAAVAVAAVVVIAIAAPFWLHSSTGPAPTSSATESPTSSLSSSTPSATASVEPSTSLAQASVTIGPAKCESFPESTSYDAAGWLGARIVVLATHMVGCGMSQELFSVDTAVGQWRNVATLTDFASTPIPTDGNSIAISTSDGGVLIIDASGRQHRIPGSKVGGFSIWGLTALPGGGYLVMGADKLYRVASDGSRVTTDPLPAGYVAVAPTSDPNLFILTQTADAQGPYGLSARNPFRAYLWDLRTGRPKLVASSVGWVERSPNSLAYLNVASDAGSTLSLAANGSTTPVAPPRAASISRDGTHYIWTSDPTSVGAVTIEMRLTGASALRLT